MPYKTKEETKEYNKNYRRTKNGLLVNIYNRSKFFHIMEFTRKEFIDKFLNDKKFNRLFYEWEKSNYKKQLVPSLDRIDNKKNYSFDNIHFMTWSENRFKQSALDGKRGRKPAVLQILNGKIIKRFPSQRMTVKLLNISQGNLSSVLNNRRKHINGYKFIYEGKI